MSYYTAEEQAQHRKELVEALRSNKYKQGRSALRLGDTYCCLGVACDLSGLGTWESGGFLGLDRKTRYYYVVDAMRHHTSLPREVANYYGILYPEGTITSDTHVLDSGRETLIEMNDHGESFETIAKFIEHDYVQLCTGTKKEDNETANPSR